MSLGPACWAAGPQYAWRTWQNSLAPAGAPGQELTLAVEGRSDYAIVAPPRPSPQERKAARELAIWLEQMTGAVCPILDMPALDNGDFEAGDDWGAGDYPPSWEAPPEKYTSAAVPQRGAHAIGGSGTSAYMPFGGRTGMKQSGVWLGPAWTLELDFAAEDPPVQKDGSAMYCSIATAGGGRVTFLVRDRIDDGRGELHFRDGLKQEEGDKAETLVLNDAIVFDDDVQKTPLVHHLRIVGRFDVEAPYYDVYLTDSDGATHQALGVRKFDNPVARGDRPVSFATYTAWNVADHLLDNVRFGPAAGQERPRKFLSVGRTDLLADAKLSVAEADLGEEGYAIARRDENLFLIGGTRRGPLYAVLALLEEDLGCRWYTSSRCASSSGINRIPRRPTLRFRPVPRRYVPVFVQREPYYSVAWDSTWSLRNRTNANNVGIPEAWGGTFNYILHAHSLGNLCPPSKYFEQFPEYFMARDDGTRIPRQLCVTNPDAMKIVTEAVLDLAGKRPNAEIIMLSYRDGQGHCRCGPCMALNVASNSPNGSLLTFVNQVAAAVEKQFPRLLIAFEAYNETLPAPTQVRPRRNVVIRICNSLHEWRYPLTAFSTSDKYLSHRFREEVAKWAGICDHLQVWDYGANHSHFLAPLPNMHTFAPDMRFYAKHNVRGIFMQGIPRVPGGERTPMRVWVLAKLMWDPDRDTRELEQDFIWGTWGEVAPLMARYYELIADLVSVDQYPPGGSRYEMDDPFITPAFLAEATRLFDEAEQLAGSERLRHRVEQARLPIMYVKLMRGPEDVGDAYVPLIERFERIAGREGMQWLGMHSGSAKLDTRVEQWRLAWQNHERLRDVKDGACQIVPLADQWRFAIDPEDRGLQAKWQASAFDDSGWTVQRTDMRSGWEKQGFPDYRGLGWYRQVLEPGAASSRAHLYVCFTAVGEDAWVYLDGEQIGERTRASTGLSARQIWAKPFAVDLTGRVADGGRHLLAVRVHSDHRLGVWKPAYLIASDMPMEASLMALLLKRSDISRRAHARAGVEQERVSLQIWRERKEAGGFEANPYMNWLFEFRTRALEKMIDERDWLTGE